MAVKPLLFVPPVIFLAMAGLFAWGMMRDNPDELPSTFIGQQAPAVPQAPLANRTPLTDEMLRTGEVTVVNFWASWCPPCRVEHPTLMQMAEDGVRIAGVNIRDQADKAEGYLVDYDDPFIAHGFDPAGRTSIDWGVTAPPETFIVGGDGEVLFRFVGPLIGDDYERRFVPALAAALAASAP